MKDRDVVEVLGIPLSLVLILWLIAPWILAIVSVVCVFTGGPWGMVLGVAAVWWLGNKIAFSKKL